MESGLDSSMGWMARAVMVAPRNPHRSHHTSQFSHLSVKSSQFVTKIDRKSSSGADSSAVFFDRINRMDGMKSGAHTFFIL